MSKFKRKNFNRSSCIVCGKKRYVDCLVIVKINFKSYVSGHHHVCRFSTNRYSRDKTCYAIFTEAKLSVLDIHNNLSDFRKLLKK